MRLIPPLVPLARLDLALELVIKLSWAALALVHVTPAAVLFAPGLIRSLYGIDAGGDLGLLIAHRGALFLAVLAVCLYAAIEPGARRAASLVTALSVISFLILYARAGMPEGALKTIALADLIALAPLALVTITAWRPSSA